MNIVNYITDQLAFDANAAANMTNAEIAAYFSAENIASMFDGDADTSPFTSEELTAKAIELRDAAKA